MSEPPDAKSAGSTASDTKPATPETRSPKTRAPTNQTSQPKSRQSRAADTGAKTQGAGVQSAQQDQSAKPDGSSDPGKRSADYLRGWHAGISAARDWHASQAKQAMVQSRRPRFPKNFEREAGLHEKAAELLLSLSPDDV